jgi:hypothetical protein
MRGFSTGVSAMDEEDSPLKFDEGRAAISWDIAQAR